MDLAYIKKVIKLVEKSEIDEIEIEEEGKKIRVAKGKSGQIIYQQVPYPPQAPYAPPAPPTPAEPAPQPKPPVESEVSKPVISYHEIRSPIVGTFYRAPAPDAAPYVEVGQHVKSGAVLCIVEAMKLMNEIESDVEGKVLKVLVENGKPVEYNQVLFHIEKS
ncbi:MAG: acetyl-CoA carboxylase biotin carboxyl carrier protein [bacterium]